MDSLTVFALCSLFSIVLCGTNEEICKAYHDNLSDFMNCDQVNQVVDFGVEDVKSTKTAAELSKDISARMHKVLTKEQAGKMLEAFKNVNTESKAHGDNANPLAAFNKAVDASAQQVEPFLAEARAVLKENEANGDEAIKSALIDFVMKKMNKEEVQNMINKYKTFFAKDEWDAMVKYGAPFFKVGLYDMTYPKE